MRVDLKSGEYYDYYTIKRVEILDYETVKITGSFAKGRKSKEAQIYLKTIKNIREFNRFLKKEMKLFQAEGICPHCGGLNITEEGMAVYTKRLNKPKEKYDYHRDSFGSYKCNGCSKRFQDLKLVNLVIYYR